MARIFLSYGRGDDEPFVERLCQALKARGLDVWFDRESMPSRRLTFHQEIRDAIAARERLVLVVGPHAVASDYVRQEWQFALEADKVVTPILRIGDYPLVPDELKLLHCEDFRDDARFEFHLNNLARQLSEPPPPLGKLIAVPSLPPHYLSRTERLQTLRDAVRADLDRPVVLTGETARVGVHGMGGIGKSVLAAALVRDRLVREAFPDGIVWIGLGSLPTITELQRRVHRDLGGDGAIATEHEGKTKLKELLADKSVLLVLDDVWRRSDADAFNVLGPRCRALITTRDAGLLTSLVGTHHLIELFTDREALNLLAHAAGVSPDALPSEANEIVTECGRLPLAVALCGGMVQGGTPWRDVLDALREHDLEYIADEHVSEAQHRSLWVAMEVSLHALPEDEQQRFAELAVFSEDTRIPEAAVLTLWSHTGGLSDRKARALLIRLKQRSLVQLNRAGVAASQNIGDVSLHDLLRDFTIALVEQRFGGSLNLHDQLLAAYQKKCPNGWPSGPNDGYFFQHLRNHFVAAGRGSELADLLHDLRWLETKNQAGLTFDLPFDFRAAINALPKTDDRRRILKLLDEALRRDINFIASHAQDFPQALFQCLWNSGWWFDCPEAARHYVEPAVGGRESGSNSNDTGARLSTLLGTWRTLKELAQPNLCWVRSLRPPANPLGAGQLSVLRGHEDAVRCVAYSPDGQRIASGACFLDCTVRVWDVISGEVLVVLCGHESTVRSVAYSPDGQRIVTGSNDNTVREWDGTSGTELAVLRGHTDAVNSVAYSPDSQWIASGSSDKTVRVWDTSSGVVLASFHSHESAVRSVAFSSDGKQIASASSDETIRVWSTDEGKEIAVLRGHEGGVQSVAFSLDDRRIASGSSDETVRLWDTARGAELAVLRGHDSTVESVTYSRNGQRIVSAAYDHTVRVWDAVIGAELAVLRGHESSVNSVVYSPDNQQIASGSSDKTVRLWDAVSLAKHTNLRDHDAQITCVAYSPDGGQVATGSFDKIVRLWDAKTGQELAALSGHQDAVVSVAYSPDGCRIATASWDKTVQIWDTANGTAVAVLHCHVKGPTNVSYSPDGRRIILGDNLFGFTLGVWDANTFNRVENLAKTEAAHTIDGGLRPSPLFASQLRLETVIWIKDAATVWRVAWFPAELDHITKSPFALSWCGSVSNHLYLIILEGSPFVPSSGNR